MQGEDQLATTTARDKGDLNGRVQEGQVTAGDTPRCVPTSEQFKSTLVRQRNQNFKCGN